jgi:phage internal scaffolding protein
MSLDYAMAKEKDKNLKMRKWCQRPGKKGEDGKPLYFTQQNHKQECDINFIINKYDRTGVISHVQKMEARYGNVSGVDFRKAQDLFINAQRMFDSLPADIKKRFNQSAGDFLEFMDDPKNRDEAIELGLIDSDWKEETDGLGEHVKSADEYKKKDPEEPAAA